MTECIVKTMYLLGVQSIVRYKTLKMETVAHERRVPYDLIHRLLTKDLQLRKYCSVWVSAELTDEHKKLTVKACRGFLNTSNSVTSTNMLSKMKHGYHGIR